MSCMTIFSHVNTVRRSRLIWGGLMHVRSDTVDARWRLIKDGEHVGHDGVTVMGERTWHLRRPEGQLDCQLTIVSPVLSQMHILLSPFSTTTNSLGHSELPSCSQTGFQNTPVPINASPQESTSPSPTSIPSRHLHPHPITPNSSTLPPIQLASTRSQTEQPS
jgi:hypothetical protein